MWSRVILAVAMEYPFGVHFPKSSDPGEPFLRLRLIAVGRHGVRLTVRRGGGTLLGSYLTSEKTLS